MNEESVFSDSFIHTFKLNKTEDQSCCVCFVEWYYITERKNASSTPLSLLDLELMYFKDNVIPDEILVLSCCKVHCICIGCMRKLINNYEAHVINEFNSHFSCPYPFKECVTEIGFKNVFAHNTIKKVCISEEEWNNYTNQAERYAFPGFTIIKCPLPYRTFRNKCNAKILVENEQIKTTPIGELVVECTQNAKCLKKFCFSCKGIMNYYQTICYQCKTSYENENPLVYNYYFNKKRIVEGSNNYDECENLYYDESDYLYLNNEITVEIATKQILETMANVENHIICSICKISLYKTEKCNGLSHHNLERCYACGRIGYQVKGLEDHWNIAGISGCFRFDHDVFVKENVKEYECNDNICSNHEKGDCVIVEHQIGIKKLNLLRKRAYIYHMLKSLLCDIKFQVYDAVYDFCKNDCELLDLLPYKQTLILLIEFKKHHRHYSEHLVYKKLHCKNADQIFTNKCEFISATEYIDLYSIKSEGSLYNMDVDIDILSDQTTNQDMLTNSYHSDLSDISGNLNIYTPIDDTESEENVLNWISSSRPLIEEIDIDPIENQQYDHLTRLLDLLQDEVFRNILDDEDEVDEIDEV